MSNVNTVARETAETGDGAFTKTTVVIPDDLLIEAKTFCVTEKTNVNELLLSGLRRELDARKIASAKLGKRRS